MKWGSLSVPVHDPSRSLDIDISLDHEVYRPADTATVHIRTTVNARATQANLIVAVVDQTLLVLLARDVLGLWQHFLSDMPLGVQTYHSLAHSVSQADLQDIYDKVEVIREAALEGIG